MQDVVILDEAGNGLSTEEIAQLRVIDTHEKAWDLVVTRSRARAALAMLSGLCLAYVDTMWHRYLHSTPAVVSKDVFLSYSYAVHHFARRGMKGSRLGTCRIS